MNESPVVEKIKKLLRLASSNNQYEAELAMSRAKQIAVENEIDLASVEAWGNKEEQKYEMGGNILSGKRLSVTSHYVCYIIQNHFKTKTIYRGSRGSGRIVTFVGKKEDIAISVYVYSYLTKTFMELWQQYQTINCVGCRSRSSYLYGLYTGLNMKLASAKQKTEENKFKEIATCDPEQAKIVKNRYALMCVQEKKNLEEAMYFYFPNLRTAQNTQTKFVDERAMSDGIKKGQSISINKGIGL